MRQTMNIAHGTKIAAATAVFLALFCLPAAVAGQEETPGVPSVDEITRRLTKAERTKTDQLQEYSVLRHYTLHNTRLRDDADMTVRVTYTKGTGKTYQILSENAEGVAKKVFQKLLDGEVEGSKTRSSHAITTDNYDFRYLGEDTVNGRPAYVLEIAPKHRTKFLLVGKLWVDAQEYGPIKMEGHPAVSLSFWAGKPQVMQTFEKVDGFWMAVDNQSSSESFLLGQTQLNVHNSNYQLQCGASEISASTRRRRRSPNVALN